jgi:hypothetical protein
MRSCIKRIYRKIYAKLNFDVQKNLILNAAILANENNKKEIIDNFDEVEFQVFSQRGEDGILQFIINRISIPNKIFIEFGVEDYTESNTRYLLVAKNWSGLVIDGSKSNINYIKEDFIYWKYDIRAVASFITTENINDLIENYTTEKDIGLLSIDIDGNDYWVWDAINTINPRIVVCEYNSAFGNSKKLTIPYAHDFDRTAAHYSNLYFGASLPALCDLAKQKGYDFVGAGSAGVNAFFVRKDLSTPFRICCAKDDYKQSANRDSIRKDGSLAFLEHSQRLNEIKELSLFDTETGRVETIKNIFEL